MIEGFGYVELSVKLIHSFTHEYCVLSCTDETIFVLYTSILSQTVESPQELIAVKHTWYNPGSV